MRIVITGKPGSGKGTQARLLSQKFGLEHLSSGEILRREISEGTPLGKKVEEYVRRGEIGPGELIARAVLNHMEKKGAGGNYVLDGFPRTLQQAGELDRKFPPSVCILLSVPNEAVISRLSGRMNCPRCGAVYQSGLSEKNTNSRCDQCGAILVRRKDDTPESINRRLEVFRKDMTPVIDFYRESGRLAEVDGTTPPEDVHIQIAGLL